MSSEDITGGQNGLNSQLVLEDDPMRFNCGHPQRRLGDPPPKTRDLIDPKLFSSDHRFFPSFHTHSHIYRPHPNPTPHWDSNDNEATSADDDSDPDDDDDDDDATGDSDPSNHQLPVALHKPTNNTPHNSNNCNNISTAAAPNHAGHRNGNPKHLSSFGSNGEVMVVKDGGGGGAVGQAANTTTTVPIDGDMYYSQYLQATEGSSGGGKNLSLENGCGFSGRKELSSFSSESGDSLRAILSDPVTGALMDDAMILPCGHSFGGGGVQHAIRMKACYTCSQPVTEESIAPNLSLQAAVQAFRREVELQFYRPSKRRRERLDQDKSHGDSYILDPPRGRGVQFPFVVTDRVIIKGNKRTPQRFVGREAVVTTQCLNGWYVVKTLDNAESVKLQYRSLAKVSDDSSSKTMPNKMTPNWL